MIFSLDVKQSDHRENKKAASILCWPLNFVLELQWYDL